MFDLIGGRGQKAGMGPGSMVYIGEAGRAPVRLELIEYDGARFEERTLGSLDDWAGPQPDAVAWLNVTGVHDARVLEAFGSRFGIHPLTLEDLANTLQRPKVEVYDGYLFVVLKMMSWDPSARLVAEQVGLVVRPGLVISFLEEQVAGDVFDGVRAALRSDRGRGRRAGADYLTYLLVDAVVDHYFVVLEQLGAEIDRVEDLILSAESDGGVGELQRVKRELLLVHNSVWPVREAVSRLERGDSTLVTEETQVYLRDVYDHSVQVMETVETFRDMASGLMDIHLANVSNRLNSVMKVLTVISTIFIPLTFITSLYGMNFDYMPELRSVYGYPVVVASMAGLALAMVAAFRWRRWL
jgi:magnesium transporter